MADEAGTVLTERAKDTVTVESPRIRPRNESISQPRRRWTDWLLAGALILSSLVVGLVQVPGHEMVSPIDEYVYIDYLAKVPAEIVRHGEETGDYARETLMCRGVRALGFYGDDLCATAATNQDSVYPMGGTNSADIYTPLYFVATWALAQPVQWLGVSDLTNAGRFTGWVWLAVAAVLLYFTLRRLRVRPSVAFGLPLLMVSSLPAYWSNTYISTDATALLAGSLMVFLAVRFETGVRRSLWIIPIAATLMTLFKLQNFGAVAVVVLFLLVRAGWDAWEQTELPVGRRLLSWLRDKRVLCAAVALIAPLLSQGIWLVIRSRIAVGEGGDQGTSTSFGLGSVLTEMFKFLVGPANGALEAGFFGVIGIVLAAVVSWVSVAGVIGVIASSPRRSIGEVLGISALIVSLLIGPALAVATIVSTGYYFTLPTRYGISLIPIFFACAGLLVTPKPFVGRLLSGVCVAAFAISLLLPQA